MISFLVPGKPQSALRPRIRTFVDKTGKARGQAYQPRQAQVAHFAVQQAAMAAMGGMGVGPCGWPSEPVRVLVEARFAYPVSTAKKRLIDRAPMAQRPDAENIAKTALDGITGIIISDDAQVAELVVRKVRVVDPLAEGMYVEVDGWNGATE